MEAVTEFVVRTFNQIIAEQAIFTEVQRSLAWSPEPKPESNGSHDCRPGGSCGLDFNRETPHAKWQQARFRWDREQKRGLNVA